MNAIKAFLMLYVIALALVYSFAGKSANPLIVPGDIYIVKAGKRLYIPISSSLIITIILFLLLRYWSDAL